MKDLLAAAMPDLPDVPDRADRVRARVEATRRRRAVTGVVATVLALAGSFAAAQSFNGGARPARDPGGASGSCPEQMTPVNPNRINADAGGFAGVDENAVAVTLCTYERVGDGLRLDAPRTVRGDVDAVVDALRALPEPDPGRNDLCTLVGRPWYRLVLDYAGHPSQSVDLDLNCGLAWSEVDVKTGDLTRPLDAFAELYRSQGGQLDPRHRW